jgi:Protein of unknown function (DUF1376)
MPYMPLDTVRLFDSDFYALSTGDEFKAGLSLWAKAFLQVPAGSLPNNDRLLAHLSGAGKDWPKVKEMALHGWFECSDGRLYHPVVAEKAREAWQARIDRRARTEAARQARYKTSNTEPTGNVTPPATSNGTDHDTEHVTHPVAVSVTDHVTGSKGSTREGKGREEERKGKEDARGRARRRPSNPFLETIFEDGLAVQDPEVAGLIGNDRVH